MARQTKQTASFVVRFTQKIFKNDDGESDVQWRGNISHVQTDDEENFSEFEDAIQFIQHKLSDLTLSSVKGKSKEEKEGILTKSFGIWKQMAMASPKMVMDAIKDPKAQIGHIQEQISQVGGELSQKMELDNLRVASKSDYKQMMSAMAEMTDQISSLTKKVDKLSKKIK